MVGHMGDYAPNGCRFKTASKMGQTVLATCPDGSECQIDLPLRIWPVDTPGVVRPIETISGRVVSVVRLK